jgi:hypothetical protein
VAENVLRFDFLARDRFSATADKVASKTDSLGTKVAHFGKTAAVAFGAAAAGGVVALGKAFVDGVKAADAYQALGLKTAAVIKSTGNQAHISVKGVQSLAAELEGLGTTDEELIINSQNVLATFTNIRNVGKNKIFDMATRSTLDMSVALGSDLQGASIQVGKALNDPIKGVGALSKVGVTFTAQQKEQIKAMVESGHTMDAQKVILGELNKEFGGAAKAAGSGFGGAVFRAKDAIGDLERDIAAKAMPTLTHLADWFTVKGVPKLREFSDWMSKKGVPKLVSGFKSAKDGVAAVWSKLELTEKLRGFAGWMGKTGAPMIIRGFERARDGIEAVWTKVKLSGIGATIVDDAKDIGDTVVTAAKDWGGKILVGVRTGLAEGDWSALGKVLGDGVRTAIGSGASGGIDLAEMVTKWIGVVDWLEIGSTLGKTAFPFALGFVSHLMDGIFVSLQKHPFKTLFFVASLIPIGKLFAAFGPLRGFLESLPFGEWVAKALDHTAVKAYDAIVTFFKFMGRKFADGFRDIIPGAAGWAGRLVRSIGDAIGLRAMYLADRVTNFFGGIGVAVGRAAGKVTLWMGRVIGWLTRPFVNAGRWLIDEGRRLIGGLITGIAGRGSGVVSSLGRIIGRITGRFVNAGRWLFVSGRRLLAGLYEGMVDKVSDAAKWAASVGGKIVRAVKNFFGIASPSKVFRSMGSNLITSLFTGMVDKNPVKLVSKIFGSMPKALGALVDKGLVSIKGLPVKAMKALSGLGGKFAGLLGFTGAGNGGGGNSKNRALGQVMARAYGWGSGPQWNALNALITGESGWRNTAKNPTSTAYGIGQFLDSTWATVGAKKTSDPAAQIGAMLRYVSQTYGSPANAYNTWASRNPHWYDAGGLARGRGLMAKATIEPERVLSPAQTRSFERLTRVLDRRSSGMSSGPASSPEIDYSRLGDHVAKAFVRAGITVTMDGRTVGALQGRQANLLGRA